MKVDSRSAVLFLHYRIRVSDGLNPNHPAFLFGQNVIRPALNDLTQATDYFLDFSGLTRFFAYVPSNGGGYSEEISESNASELPLPGVEGSNDSSLSVQAISKSNKLA